MPSFSLFSYAPRARRSRVRACGRAALERIIRIRKCLGQEQQVTAHSLATELETSARTMKRDIELMRDQLGVPIAWDVRAPRSLISNDLNHR